VKYFENILHNVYNAEESGSTLGLSRQSIELMNFHNWWGFSGNILIVRFCHSRDYDCICV